MLQLVSDSWFSYGTYKSVKLMSTLSSAPVYSYKFSFDGHLGLFKRLLGLRDFKGNKNAAISYLTYYDEHTFISIRFVNEILFFKSSDMPRGAGKA